MKKIVRMFVGIFVFMAMVGFVFPMILSAMAQVLFPVQAQGSLIIQENTIKGSSLVGQNFKENDELWGRPSANNYQLNISGSSNLSVSSEAYKSIMIDRINLIQRNHPSKKNIKVPIDLVTESASGLDPHISVDAAMYQINRLEEHTNLDEETIKRIIVESTKDNLVNVLEVNLLLEGTLLGNEAD